MTMKILVLALMVLGALGGSAMAAASSTTQTTQVSASLSSYISLSVPASISGWGLNQGPNTLPVNGLTVNSNAPWHVQVQTDTSSGDYYGHFWSANAQNAKVGASVNGNGIGFLTNPLVLNALGLGSGDVPLSDQPAPLANGVSLGGTLVPFNMKQNVAATDPAENDYKIVILFTANN